MCLTEGGAELHTQNNRPHGSCGFKLYTVALVQLIQSLVCSVACRDSDRRHFALIDADDQPVGLMNLNSVSADELQLQTQNTWVDSCAAASHV